MSRLPEPTPQEIRQEFEQLVINDLLGPAQGPDEEINENWVSSRYILGCLAPRDVGKGTPAAQARIAAEKLPEPNPLPDDNPLNPVSDDTPLAAGSDESGEEGQDDDPITSSDSMIPNSLGLTFCLAPDVDRLRLTVSWGWYRKRPSEAGFLTKKGDPKLVWYRKQIKESTVIDLKKGDLDSWIPYEDIREVSVKGQVRQADDGTKMVTLFLVNDQDGTDGKDDKWLFQVKLRAQSEDGKAVFTRRAIQFDDNVLDGLEQIENQQTRMNYRNRAEFAVGHGTSVDWSTSPDASKATAVWVTPVPAYEVAKARPHQIPGLNLGMQFLAGCPQEKLSTALTPMVTAYREWIETQSKRQGDPNEHLRGYEDALAYTTRKAKTAADRIEQGIKFIAEDKNAYKAFSFMNQAMNDQRLHGLLSQSVRRGDKTTLEEVQAKESPAWYPFQLAFILINLPSIAMPDHPERSEGANSDPTAELLWFPTGGGKTEAYLGLTAFTLAIRRLQGEVEGMSGRDGVAVLMRYTLRLLTLQQFQRATTLMCACEMLRREDPKEWSSTPFRIGLWVGMSSTPNSFDKAEEALDDARGGDNRRAAKGTLQQLTNCPWCGESIEVGRNLVPDVERRRLVTYCGDPLGRCPFSRKKSEWEGLPICTVDEEIYRLLPSLVIATVDKFAQMPWNGETAMLFGRASRHCPRHGFLCPSSKHAEQSHQRTTRNPAVYVSEAKPPRPPDLIIQDELHLITGPLGSLVGIYETAIDELCSWEFNGKRVRPKIVVSTATIRKATDQVNALFARRLEIFPPRGVDAEDNFFSKQVAVTEDNPGLRYVGICSPGKRLKVALIRVYVACLCAGQTIYTKYGRVADPYMTLIGYFSSIRELGGMRRLLDDDIRTRIQQMDKRGLVTRSFVGGYDELTSRKTAGDIPRMLDWLEADFDPEKEAVRKTERDAGKKPSTRAPADAIIATNMISVGVDVQRLGLMIVAGQPKQTSEYVQATARVGRKWPGLIFTVHNWARPRDLSHFETFRHFHETFHAFVEAPSVTPFAPGARERAEAGVLTALVRLQDGKFNPDKGAGDVKERSEPVKEAISTFKARASRVISPSLSETVERECNGLIDYWIGEANRPNRQLVYKEAKDFARPLLRQPDEGPWDKFTCLNSLREVEQSSNLVLIELPEDPVPVEVEEEEEE